MPFGHSVGEQVPPVRVDGVDEGAGDLEVDRRLVDLLLVALDVVEVGRAADRVSRLGEVRRLGVDLERPAVGGGVDLALRDAVARPGELEGGDAELVPHRKRATLERAVCNADFALAPAVLGERPVPDGAVVELSCGLRGRDHERGEADG